jgi:hypothetical protein
MRRNVQFPFMFMNIVGDAAAAADVHGKRSERGSVPRCD